MSAPVKLNQNQIHYQDPIGVIFIPWSNGSMGSNGYDVNDIVGDTFSLTQDDATHNTVPHEFSDNPLDDNTTLGEQTVTMQCLDFQNDIMKNMFGCDTDTNGFVVFPKSYIDLYCTIILLFSNKALVLTKVKMDSKTVFENLRSDIARGELSGTLYDTPIKYSSGSVDGETAKFFMQYGKDFTISGVTVSIFANGDVDITGSSPTPTVITVNILPDNQASSIATNHGYAYISKLNGQTDPQHTGVGHNTIIIASGENIEATAVADTGYEFEKWNDNNTTNPRTVTPSADTALTAQFGYPTITTLLSDLTYDRTEEDNNTIFVVQLTGAHLPVLSNGGVYTDGTLTVQGFLDETPTGQWFLALVVSGSHTYSEIEDIIANETITYKEYFTVYVTTIQGNGTTKINGESIQTIDLPHGASCILSATPASGKTFNYWSGNGVAQDPTNPLTYTVDRTKTSGGSIGDINYDIIIGAYFTS